ncbi:50S ribosomal protein L18 [Candidatus Pacearchaeota archaeon]|nr:50S ribosomal protein L18 [Candidatus Pacearchaeota archaeon]|tara:strand:- start:1768 stop:2259 length:492 start_codon:yes stop_codon:yes gene_type:complete
MKTLKRRRKEHKTNYGRRLKLLKSEKPRVIFRRTNKYIIAQYVKSKEAKDKVVWGINSKDLLKYGWPESKSGSLKSITAAYLIGYLIGKQIASKKLVNPIVDSGMVRTLHKTKVFAFLKGLKDAGVKIKCKDETFPSDDRIKGEHLKDKIPFEEIKSKIGNLK